MNRLLPMIGILVLLMVLLHHNFAVAPFPLYAEPLAPVAINQPLLAPLQKIKQITTGANHTCALTNSGNVKCWGYNWAGQVGNNSMNDSRLPVTLIGLNPGVSHVSAGGGHTCALTADGVQCWGANGDNRLGNGLVGNRLTPVNATDFPTTTKMIVAGGAQTCLLSNANGASCVGHYSTALGDNLSSGVRQIAAGHYYACALLQTGGVQCWGFNQYGELGYGLSGNSSTPVDVNGLDSGVQSITTGFHHACALLVTGRVKCWGWNNTGQLGDGTVTNRYAPVDVSSLSNVTAVSAGKMHTCALINDGSVACWGENAAGQLGDGSVTRRETPGAVTGLHGVTAIDAGDDHTCALLNSGGVKCWGSNATWQIGQNEPFYSTPVDVMAPLVTPDQWQPMATVNAPAGRSANTILWSGTEVLVWGGETATGGFATTNTGGRYNPVTDSWQPITTTNAPTARRFHSAIWTGTEMIIWGGEAGNSGPTFNNGGRYNPKTDSWQQISTLNAPSGRLLHSAVWTGVEMIVWGGDLVSPDVVNTKTGGRYNPITDTWAPLIEIGAPSARNQHKAVWTGSEMIIWGGIDNCCATNDNSPSGGRYNLQFNAWQPMAASDPALGFLGNALVWTGNELLVWGGHTRFNAQSFIGQRYNPKTNTWRAMNTTGAPSARRLGNHHWTGHVMVVWGGYDGNTWPNSGGGYDPVTDSWFTIPMTGAPPIRSGAATWTGDEMVVWSGFFDDGVTSYFFNSGARYAPLEQELRSTTTPTYTLTVSPTHTPTLAPTFTPTPPTPSSPTSTATLTPTPTSQPLPLPTDPPPATPTTSVEPIATPSSTATATATKLPQAVEAKLYMPVALRLLPVATATPQLGWQRVGQAGLNARAIAIHNSQLFVGERKQEGVSLGGLYHRILDRCQATPTLTRMTMIQNSSVLGLAFQNSQAVAATYDINLFYSHNHGIDWQQSNTTVFRPRTVAIAGGSVFYAGTEDLGIYESTTGGVTWQQLDSTPGAINRVVLNTGTLWIGAQSGVFKRTLGGLTPVREGLPNAASKEVWDFAFRAANEIYIATFDGVYQGDGATPWRPFGLQGKNLYSLELNVEVLYAGVHQGGVWRRPLNGGDWQEVSSADWKPTYSVHDLLFEPTSCQGLLAATTDGIWLYR